MKVLREFQCELTGVQCVIILNAFGDEICITKQEFIELQSRVEYDERLLQMEIG